MPNIRSNRLYNPLDHWPPFTRDDHKHTTVRRKFNNFAARTYLEVFIKLQESQPRN